MNKLLKKLEVEPISLEKISKLCPSLNPVIYDELPENTDLKAIFKGKESACVFYEMHGGSNVGHFSFMKKKPKGVEYFSSYGFRPEVEINLTKSTPGKLKNILKQSNTEINTVRYQSERESNTCGRWCILRYRFRHLPLQEFNRIFSSNVSITSRDDLGVLSTLALVDGA